MFLCRLLYHFISKFVKMNKNKLVKINKKTDKKRTHPDIFIDALVWRHDINKNLILRFGFTL